MNKLKINEKQKKENLVEVRTVLSSQKKLKVIKVFDTIEKTSGEKDVSLCQTQDGNKVILRIGEIRPSSFFLNGFESKHFVIPKIYERQEAEIPYEIEEYLDGILVCDFDKQQSKTGKIDPKISKKLLATFWEFQYVAANIGLEQKFDKSKILKHFEKAKPLLQEPQLIQKLINQYENFWKGAYPSKWKFSTDNLIMMPGNKIGFIDNAEAGLRYFGYDLGWLLWPRWVEMETKHFDEVNDHFKYLKQFMKQAYQMAPEKIENFEKNFWLVIFDRLVGAIYDVACDTRHLNDWGMKKNGNKKRKEKHLVFLNKLLALVVKKL
ncbi:hypothetical protein HY750_02725 [Candidatus Kuenenbacteria bacterium]|nr:hypothetical protein [Candidatus Kuenenbacteria bacterium]